MKQLQELINYFKSERGMELLAIFILDVILLLIVVFVSARIK